MRAHGDDELRSLLVCQQERDVLLVPADRRWCTERPGAQGASRRAPVRVRVEHELVVDAGETPQRQGERASDTPSMSCD